MNRAAMTVIKPIWGSSYLFLKFRPSDCRPKNQGCSYSRRKYDDDQEGWQVLSRRGTHGELKDIEDKKDRSEN